MDAVVHLDTHVVVWLYNGLLERIPESVQEVLEKHSLAVSPIVALELQYLHEIKRLKATSRVVLADLATRIGLQQSDTPFARVTAEACDLKWTHDPFDRLIVGNALVDDAILVTADQVIRKHYKRARWD